MTYLSGAEAAPTSYLYRNRERSAELRRLVEELEQLRRDRRNHLGRIRSIGLRLHALADEHRKDSPPQIDEGLHVSLWRRIDIQARRADLILTSDAPPLDALDAELAEVECRSPDVSLYDIALMHLTGDPLPQNAPEAAVQQPVTLQAWIGRIVGLAALASPVVLLSFAGRPLTGVLLVIAAISSIPPLRRWLQAIFEEPDPVAPNVRAEGAVAEPVLYDHILEHSILQLNASVERPHWIDPSGAKFDQSIIELQTLLQTLQRVRAPAVAARAHADETALVAGWLGILQAARSRAPHKQAVREMNELADRANEEIDRFRAAIYGPSPAED